MSPLHRNPSAGVIPLSEVNYASLVSRIKQGDQTAQAEFAQLFSRGIRFLLSRKLQPVDVEQGLQNTLSAVLREIQVRKVFEQDQLVGFVLATLKLQRSTLSQRDTQAHKLSSGEKESLALVDTAKKLLEQIIRKMPESERDVLRRYYIAGERPEVIQRSLNLSLKDIQRIITEITARFKSLNRAPGADKQIRH